MWKLLLVSLVLIPLVAQVDPQKKDQPELPKSLPIEKPKPPVVKPPVVKPPVVKPPVVKSPVVKPTTLPIENPKEPKVPNPKEPKIQPKILPKEPKAQEPIAEMPISKLPKLKVPIKDPPKDRPPRKEGGSWHWHPHYRWIWLPLGQGPRTIILDINYQLPERVYWYRSANYIICPHCGEIIYLE